jgi:hypothetical protein
MPINVRKLEAELQRIFRHRGVSPVDLDGVCYVGICTARVDGGVHIPTMPPRSAPVSLAELAREIAEAMA